LQDTLQPFVTFVFAGIMTDGAGVPTGTPLPDPPLIESISEDPVLRDTKMIAEAWDCDGLNQVCVSLCGVSVCVECVCVCGCVVLHVCVCVCLWEGV
jgi:hypothetical protein